MAFLLALLLATTGPVNSSPPTIVGVVQAGATVRADPGTWTGQDPITYVYAWRVCADQGATNCHQVGVGESLKVPPEPGWLAVDVTASDATGSATVSSAPYLIKKPPVSTGGQGPAASITVLSPRARIVHDTWVHVVVRGSGRVSIAGKPGQPYGRGTYDLQVPLRHLGVTGIPVSASGGGKTVRRMIVVELRYPRLTVVAEDPFSVVSKLGCSPCLLTDPSDGHGGADVDRATSRVAGGRIIFTVHVRNSLSAGGANVCLFVERPRRAGDPPNRPSYTYSAGCYGPKLNDGSRDWGPVVERQLDSRTVQLSFALSQIGSPPWVLWRVWSHSGDHTDFDLAPNGGSPTGPGARLVKQQVRFQTSKPR